MQPCNVSRIVFVAALAAAPLTASAQCAGFTDVSPVSSFCTNVTWIKNRAITLGCTSATTYCPNDPVVRLQMAAFLNRLGNVVTPNAQNVLGNGGAMMLVSPNYVCQTADLPSVMYDRTVVANADFTFLLTALQDVTVNVVVSNDGGATWSNLNLELLTILGSGPGWNHATTVVPAGAHPAGETRRYAIRAVRGPRNLNESIVGWTCGLQVYLRTTAQ